MARLVQPRFVCALGAAIVVAFAPAPSSQSQPARGSAVALFGFTAKSAEAERLIERRFLAIPSAQRARDAHAFLTAEPHVAGSARDRLLAEWVRDRWREDGLEQVEIVEHQVMLPAPLEVTVEMTQPRPWKATLREDPVPGDPYSARDVGPAWHVYSASGEVTAPVVYAGSGNPEDYEWLAKQGIDIKGRIALVRYSMPYSYRGFKALTAQRLGAAGILIYSDPADDGFKKGKVYPDGPWGPESHIQRGGIVYDFNVPGDPLTPGWASVPGAKRIAAKDATSLPAIMSAPLSWRDARVLLEALGGPDAPAKWQGGIPITYHVGPGAPTVHMRIRMDDSVRPIWTVTGRITGSEHPEDLVVLGNHRDAWVYGGVDPSSGTASMMELARSLGALARDGTRPKRTIVFANWDAEEFTLTSSTEWGEQYEPELSAHAIAYLNVDSSTSGPSFGASAVPSLNRSITEVAGTVIDPDTGLSIAEAWRRGGRAEAGALPGSGGRELVANRLGSGSDYTVFLNFLGVPVADLAFNGPYGVYHSIYDNHAWMSKFGDPTFRYHTAMTAVWGLLALRLANADVVPLEYGPYAARLGEFTRELEAYAGAGERDLFQPLDRAVEHFAAAATACGRAVDATLAAGAPAARTAAINHALTGVERAFLDREGLPGRPWYRHLLYAPRPTYAPEILPGVAEALEAGDRPRLSREIARLTAAVDRATDALRLQGNVTSGAPQPIDPHPSADARQDSGGLRSTFGR